MGGINDRDTDLGNDEPTVPDSGSVLSEALRDVGFSLNEIVRDLAENARLVPRLQGDERGPAIRELAKKMGSLGDLAHETRQALDALADDTFLLSRL